jgi:hypothetical protein
VAFLFVGGKAMQGDPWADFDAFHQEMVRQEREEAPRKELEEALRPKRGRRNGPLVGYNPITKSVYVNRYPGSGWKPDERLSPEARELLEARFASFTT